jgi:hypothetical protein
MTTLVRSSFRRSRSQVCTLLTAGVIALFCSLVSPERASAQTTFTVTASGFSDYTVNGQPDPGITLVRGTTYTFNVTASGHPFFIKTVAGAGEANQFNTGVTNNGVQVGTLTFTVPASAPAQLFYQCSVHGAMSGVITIVNPPPVPSGGPLWSLLLALGLIGLTFALSRMRPTLPGS